jgi:hypothetical protein
VVVLVGVIAKLLRKPSVPGESAAG